MHIQFRVNGHYDWESAEMHPGVQITPADVKALRAKPDNNEKWLIRVEKKLDPNHPNSFHDANIPEQQICYFMLWQAVHGGNEWARNDAACELMRHSYKHHGRVDHIEDASAHDSGPNEELFDSFATRCLDEYRAQLAHEARWAAAVGDALIAAGVSAETAKHVSGLVIAGAPAAQIDTALKVGGADPAHVQSALATAPYAEDSDAGKAATSAAQSQIDATIASAQRTAGNTKTRYMREGSPMHDHVRAHFAPHAVAADAKKGL